MNFLNNMRIGRKLAMAFAMLITISVIVSAMTYERLSFIQEANRMQVHTYNVLDQVDLAVAGMVDQETGFRAYLLAGEDKFLEPYRKGRVAFEAAVSRAKQLTSDNPAQQVRLTELQRLGDQWRTEVAEKAIAMMAKPETREAARQIEISGAGKQFMDGLRAKAAEIAAIEQGLMVQRSAALDEAFATEYAVAIIGGVLSFSLATLFALLLSRTIAAPTARMTAVMLELAKGNKSIEVPDRDRKDEIGEMAQTVEVFKRNAIEAERLAAAQAAEE
ncbi:MAG TPA: CHASE3 domain-containing protein, partial [Alphaproteobacteria bacterium]|nr:CHASE3 domain-containing protein [Alphaproteobacteria bacterium]